MANETIYPFGQGGNLPSGYPIVNDYHTGGADKAVSAEVGKEIGETVFGSDEIRKQIDLSNLSVIEGGIAAGKFWTDSGTSVLLPVSPGNQYQITAPQSGNANYAFLASNTLVDNASPTFATGYSDRVILSSGNTVTVSTPDNAISLWIKKTTKAGLDILPDVYQIQLLIVGLVDEVEELSSGMVKNTFNSSFNVEDTETARNEFCGMLKGTDKIETFLFFSDPHLTDYSRYETMTELVRDGFISTLQKYYNSLPLDYCICGGDWLNSSHTDKEACGWLGYCDAYMRKLFRNYYPAFGNHDCNPYKFGLSPGSFPYSQGWPYSLDYKTVQNLYFRENGGAYYSFDGINTKFYVLNSGVSFIKEMTDSTYSYLLDDRWGQVAWFANKLITDDPENAIIISHIYSNASSASDWNSSATGYWAKGVHQLSRNLRDVAIAFNKRQSITKNGVAYNFSNCTGRVALYLCGHTHFDFVDTYDELPVVCFTNLEGGHFDGNTYSNSLTPTFDCCLVDYDNNKLKTLRVGAGVSRIVNFATETVPTGSTKTLTSELSGTLTWSSRDTSIATVSSGVVTPIASGVVGIIATDESGKQEYWIVNVS